MKNYLPWKDIAGIGALLIIILLVIKYVPLDPTKEEEVEEQEEIIHFEDESRLEVALAGFAKEEVNVYTEYGKLHIEGTKSEPDEEETFIHRGLAKRTFKRSWTIAEDTHVTDVAFDNGLLVVKLGKIVPEHHARKDYLT